MISERFDNLLDPPHYYEIHSRQGVSAQAWTWGKPETIASQLAKKYQEPGLRRVLGGELRAVIYSSDPLTFCLESDGTALRINMNKRPG